MKLQIFALFVLITQTGLGQDSPNPFPAAPPIAAEAPKPKAVPLPEPTLANIPYGPHERQVLDFWQADSQNPAPVLFYIHGGGWVRGDKSSVGGMVRRCLKAGISVVSINYRYTWQAQLAEVKPPVEWPMKDAARALQFVRSKAQDWHINPQRIG
ncbi:MAG: alpha/beta hydrolase, partial [Proteobacteria bacterium]|nr:alpha/beta hydrolase [Pseudomonadota bacterium]